MSKVKTALVFAAGMAAGVYSVPLVFVYCKPVQRVLAKSFSEFATKRLGEDAKLRQEAIDIGELFINVLKAYPDDK